MSLKLLFTSTYTQELSVYILVLFNESLGHFYGRVLFITLAVQAEPFLPVQFNTLIIKFGCSLIPDASEAHCYLIVEQKHGRVHIA